MEANQRKVALVTTLGKKYSGIIDIPSDTFRTTDLFNSANIFWKNPNEKCYENAILMYDVRLYLDDSALYRKFDKIQIKLSEIFYLYDDIEGIGDETEKKRAAVMIQQTREQTQTVNIITKEFANAFYDITGLFYGLFKKKSQNKFIPLTQVTLLEISKKQDKWVKRQISLPHNFICVSNQHVESMTFK